MRKWIWITPVLLVVGFAGYWFIKNNSGVPPMPDAPNPGFHVTQQARNDGDAEASEVIEPLIVDRGVAPVMPTPAPAAATWLPRVEWTPGVSQPPRPDREPGRVLRMPYADEDEILRIPLDPLQRVLAKDLPRFDLFSEELFEESELPDLPRPMIDPHHPPHCPHFGGCPALPSNMRRP